MKKFFKVVGIGTAICTAVGAGVVLVKMVIDKVNNNDEDIVEDEQPEFEETDSEENSEANDQPANSDAEE